MARRAGGVSLRPPQLIPPRGGAVSPVQGRSRVVLPAPLGPTIRVGGPGVRARFSPSGSVVAPACSEPLPSTSGSSVEGAPTPAPLPFGPDPRPPRGGVDRKNDND